MSGKVPKLLLFFLIAFSMTLCSSSYAQPQSCSNYAFFGNRFFRSCTDLPVLNSFLHYNYFPSSGTLQIAYRHTDVSPTQWVAWAVNPISTGMVGSQSLIAYQQTDGTIRVYTTPINAYRTQLQEGKLMFDVSDLSASYAHNQMIIFATFRGINPNSTRINHVWQDGPLYGNTPMINPTSGANVLSMGTLDIVSGRSQARSNGGNSGIEQRNIHGILNVVSWGILMPLGALIAKYSKLIKSTNPAWFYLHVSCQLSAYIIGVAGWGTGMKLGAESAGIQHSVHRNIGITLFSLATLQVVFALFLRPNPDHQFRICWTIYHELVGYSVIVLSATNVFKGFDILQPEKIWKYAYIGFLAALGLVFVAMEAFSCSDFLKRKRSEAGAEDV